MVIMLRQCCCCFSLKTGTLIIGVLNSAGGLGNIIFGSAAAVAAPAIHISDEGTRNVFVGEGAALAVLGWILLVVSFSLLIGAKNDILALLVPWMVYTIVFLIANTILYILFAVQYFSLNNTVNGAAIIVAVVIYNLLQPYFLLVVYSLYRELNGRAPIAVPTHA